MQRGRERSRRAGKPVAITAETIEQIHQAVTLLARVGIETVKGYLLSDDFMGKTKPSSRFPSSGRIKRRRIFTGRNLSSYHPAEVYH